MDDNRNLNIKEIEIAYYKNLEILWASDIGFNNCVHTKQLGSLISLQPHP